MLSTENPPDPSCSCKAPALNSDERAPSPSPPDRLSSPESDPAAGLGGTQPSPFSIRDYVFTSRSKDIRTNWPFPQKYLQLCLKHGVRELLPPFEPPASLRAQSSGKDRGSKQLVVCSEVERTRLEVDPIESYHFGPLNEESDAIKYGSCLPADRSVLVSSDQAWNPLSEDKLTVVRGVSSNDELTHKEAEIESTVTSRDRIVSIPSPVGGILQSLQESRSLSESSVGEVAKPPPLLEKVANLRETSVKKCRLIVKLGTVPEANRTEDIISNSSSVSDLMASKVCPVGKIFSSTSNTTLNAHIDQCLSVESTAKRVVTSFSKHKVKPRKKRTMVDIYATAARCTLEDLDRRNGTNWALDLNMAAQTSEACTTESKRPRLSPVVPIDDETEGPVYVDSNGTKLRILSKSNDSQPAAAVEEFKSMKFRKAIKDARSFTFAKKKHLSPKRMRYMKVKQQSKKLSPFKIFKGEIDTGSEGKLHMDTHQEKGESLSQTSTVQQQVKVNEPGTLGQWVCSKRSGLSKKLNNKVSRRSLRNPVTIMCNPLAVSNRSVLGDSSASTSHILNLSRPSDDITSSSKIKCIDTLSNPVHATDNGEKHSPIPPENSMQSMRNTFSTDKGLMLNLPRSSGNNVSSPRSKRMEIHTSVQNLTPRTSQSCRPLSPKAKRGSTLRKIYSIKGPSCPVEASKCNDVEKGLNLKKLRELRSVEPCEHGEKLLSDVDEGFHNSPRDSDLGLASNDLTSKMHQSNLSQGILRPETKSIIDQAKKSNEGEKVTISKKLRNRRSVEKHGKHGEKLPSAVNGEFHDSHRDSHIDSRRNKQFNLSKNNKTPERKNTVNQVSPSPGNTVDSEQGKESTVIMKRRGSISLKHLRHGAECHGSELADTDLPVELSADANTMVKCSREKAVGMPDSDETVTFENLTVSASAKLDPSPSLKEHIEPTTGAWVDSSIPRLLDDQGVHCSDEASNEIAGQNTGVAGRTESREKDESRSELENTRGHLDLESVEGSSVCLTSSGDNVLDASHGNSSVTSVGAIPCQDHYMVMDGEPSGSPVSAGSIISHPLNDVVKLKVSKSGPSAEPVAVQEKLSPHLSSNLALPPLGIRGTERAHLKKSNQDSNNATAPVQESDKFWVNQPCCCSRRESISQEPQPLRQSIIADMTLPSKAKLMASNLSIRPVLSSSFGTQSMLRTEDVANPILDSPTDSVSMKMFSDPTVRFSNYTDFGMASPSGRTQPQFTSSPILRLMGKDLKVVNKEEEPVLPQKQFAPCSSTDTLTATYSSLLRFSPTRSVSNQGSILYRPHQFLENPVFMGNNPSDTQQVPPSMRIGSFMGTLQIGSDNKTDPRAHQKRLNKKPSSPFGCNLEKVSLHHQRHKPVSTNQAPVPTREVIVIDDSPETEAEPKGTLPNPAASTLPPAFLGSNLRPVRSFACLPHQNPFQLRDQLQGGRGSVLPISCPRSNANTTKQVSTSEASGSLLPRPFMVPPLSAGRLATPTMYYSPSLRQTPL